MSNMDLRHKSELLHSLLVAMVTEFSYQQGYLCIATKSICAKYFHVVELLLYNSLLLWLQLLP